MTGNVNIYFVCIFLYYCTTEGFVPECLFMLINQQHSNKIIIEIDSQNAGIISLTRIVWNLYYRLNSHKIYQNFQSTIFFKHGITSTLFVLYIT